MPRSRHKEFTATEEALIREHYANPIRGRQKLLHLTLGVPSWRIHHYVKKHKLSVVSGRRWDEAEIALLDELANQGYTDPQIQNRLQTAGYRRSVHAIQSKRYACRLLSTDPDLRGWYTCQQVAEVMGVAPQTVHYWINQGWLQPDRDHQSLRGGLSEFRWQISEHAWRRFLITHPERWKMQRVAVQSVVLHLLLKVK